MTIVAASVVGIVVGLFSGLLGIGGGTIMVPVFRLIFGMSPIGATATSFFTIIPTSIAGLYKHTKNQTSVLSLGLVAGLAGAVMSPLGVLAASHAPGWVIMAAAACVIAYSAISMFLKALHGLKQAGNALVPEMTRKSLVTGGLIGLVAGFIGGFVGVGGGFIMVPLFVSLLGIPMVYASGTSLMAVMLLAIPGTIEQALLGNISYTIGLAMAIGSMPGAVWGASLAKRIPDRNLKFIFSGFLLLVAILLIGNECSGLG